MQRRPDFSGQEAQPGDVADEHTVYLREVGAPGGGAAPPPPIGNPGTDTGTDSTSGELPAVTIAPPTVDPGGGLTTYIGAPDQAQRSAHATRAAQHRAQQEVSAVAASLAEIAAALHSHAAYLERFVEGSYASDLADPRTRLLSQTLEIARQADLRLAQLGATLRRLDSSVHVAQNNLAALQRERERLTSLYAVAQQLNTSLDLDDVLGRVMAQLIEVVRAERGFLMLWNDASGQLQFTAARGADGSPLAERDFNLSTGAVAGVWKSQQPLLTVDARDDARLAERQSVVAYGIRSVMCAPLRVRGRAVGIVYVDSRERSALFDIAHLDLLAAFCNQAAIAIDNARLFADLRRRIREIGEMKTYMDNIFGSIASGVVTADTLGAITTFNRAAERIFGITSASALGQPYDAVLTGLGDAALPDILRRAVAEQRVTLGHEIERTLPRRGDVSLRFHVSPLRSSEGEGAGEPLGVAMVVEDLTELRRSQRQAEEIQTLFGRYVHPAVVRQLLADPGAVRLGGETREISVIFADIRGYTTLAERLDPAELVRVLNGYLHVLTEAIWREEGTLTMFIGDALMAIFNAPLPQPDHPHRAVRAAWGMRRALEAYRAAQGPDALPVEYGIGVHTGFAVVGNIGARDRMQNYTAIGDAVNTAQRLQAGASANTILLSAATYLDVLPYVLAHELDPLSVKGKTHPLSVYQLDGMRE